MKKSKLVKSDKKENPKLGVIKVGKIIDQPDGSALMNFEADDVFVAYCKEQTGVKRVTKKVLADFVLGILMKSVAKKDGYALEDKDGKSL